jgi:hypothetical protein
VVLEVLLFGWLAVQHYLEQGEQRRQAGAQQQPPNAEERDAADG